MSRAIARIDPGTIQGGAEAGGKVSRDRTSGGRDVGAGWECLKGLLEAERASYRVLSGDQCRDHGDSRDGKSGELHGRIERGLVLGGEDGGVE